MKILLIEDNPINAKVLERILVGDGYTVIAAQNGPLGLEALRSTPDVALVITDIMMPGMDGLDLLTKMKAHAGQGAIPVLVVSSLSDNDTVKRAVALGCQGYLVKPVQKAQVLKKVREVLGIQNVVLQPKSQIRHDLGLEASEYDDLARSFLQQVKDGTALLDQAQRGLLHIDHLRPQLKLLAENASLLGAEKFVKGCSRFLSCQQKTAPPRQWYGGFPTHTGNVTTTQPSPICYAELIGLLKELQTALESASNDSSPGIPPETDSTAVSR